MSPMRTSVPAVLAAVAAFGSGCGGDDGPTNDSDYHARIASELSTEIEIASDNKRDVDTTCLGAIPDFLRCRAYRTRAGSTIADVAVYRVVACGGDEWRAYSLGALRGFPRYPVHDLGSDVVRPECPELDRE